MDDLKKIGLAIKKCRRDKMWTQEDLAGLAGIDRSYLSEVESGNKNVSIQKFIKISEALEIEPSRLLSMALNPGKDPMESKDGMITLPLPKIIKIAESLNVAPEELLKNVFDDK